jgi:hypothetical protein
MNNRTGVTPADLFVLLDREFRRRKPRECAACFIQLPYRVDVKEGPNWEVVTPPRCGKGCEEVFEALVQEFQSLYQLKNASEDERA